MTTPNTDLAERGGVRPLRCEACGRFTRRTKEVLDFRSGGRVLEACDKCCGGGPRDKEIR